jgi:3',5'-nucleoside bisphosphate phosphatase
LGYCFDLTHKGFRFFIEQIQKNREQRNHKILENLSLLGINIDPKLLFTKSIIGRPHIAQMLVEKKVVRNLQEAFDLYLKEGAKAYHSGIVPTPQQVIENIHEANGKAIIAHPHVVKSSILQNLYDLPFDGIECYYARFSSDREKPFIKIAKKKNWLITGGSDFHGSIKPRNALGSSWIDEKEFNLLRT